MAKIRCSNLEKEVQIIKAATVLWNTVHAHVPRVTFAMRHSVVDIWVSANIRVLHLFAMSCRWVLCSSHKPLHTVNLRWALSIPSWCRQHQTIRNMTFWPDHHHLTPRAFVKPCASRKWSSQVRIVQVLVSTSKSKLLDQGNEGLRKQVHKLQYEVDSLKQEREVTALQYRHDLRAARNKAESDLKRAQVRRLPQLIVLISADRIGLRVF